MRDSRGYLCHLCISKAKTYYKLHNDPRKIEEVVVKFSCLTAVEGAQSRSRPLNQEERTEQRGREGDQTTPNATNARKRLRTMSSCLQNDVESPITPAPATLSQSFVSETELQNSYVTVSYL